MVQRAFLATLCLAVLACRAQPDASPDSGPPLGVSVQFEGVRFSAGEGPETSLPVRAQALLYDKSVRLTWVRRSSGEEWGQREATEYWPTRVCAVPGERSLLVTGKSPADHAVIELWKLGDPIDSVAVVSGQSWGDDGCGDSRNYLLD
jgi:hypothetical protein